MCKKDEVTEGKETGEAMCTGFGGRGRMSQPTDTENPNLTTLCRARPYDLQTAMRQALCSI